MTFCSLKSGSKSDTEDQLARLDEQVRRISVGEAFVERCHFFDAAASMWVGGELVHVEDLVLHDARMDVRAPTHELTIAHGILRASRIAGTDPGWAVSDSGVAALTGYVDNEQQHRPDDDGKGRDDVPDSDLGGAEDHDDPLARQLANVDALLDRSRRLIDRISGAAQEEAEGRSALIVGGLMLRDPEWDEQDRLAQWKRIMQEVEKLPAVLGGALLWDAWETLEPMQRQHWLGGQLVSAYLRARGKVDSHLFGFNVGLKAVPRERRRAQVRVTRLIAFLDAMSSSADAGMKEIARLAQAREQMERRLRGRRSSSSLPAVVELVLSRPIVSAAMIAKAAKVTQRGALNLIADLGVRKMTGRGRYRAWGIL
jgi:hypothetical protein